MREIHKRIWKVFICLSILLINVLSMTTNVNAGATAVTSFWVTDGSTALVNVQPNSYTTLRTETSVDANTKGYLEIIVPTVSFQYGNFTPALYDVDGSNGFTSVEEIDNGDGTTSLIYKWHEDYFGPLHVDVAVRAIATQAKVLEKFTITSTVYLGEEGEENLASTTSSSYQVYDFSVETVNLSISKQLPKGEGLAAGEDATFIIRVNGERGGAWENASQSGPTIVGDVTFYLPIGTVINSITSSPTVSYTYDESTGLVTLKDAVARSGGNISFTVDVTLPDDLGTVGDPITIGGMMEFKGHYNGIVASEQYYETSKENAYTDIITDSTGYNLSVRLYIPQDGGYYEKATVGENATDQAFAWLSIKNFGSVNYSNFTVEVDLPDNMQMNKIHIPDRGSSTSSQMYWDLEVILKYDTNQRTGLEYTASTKGYHDAAMMGLQNGEYITKLTLVFPAFNSGYVISGNLASDASEMFMLIGDVVATEGDIVKTIITSVSSDAGLIEDDDFMLDRAIGVVKIKKMTTTNTNSVAYASGNLVKWGDTFSVKDQFMVSSYGYNGSSYYIENPVIYIVIPDWLEYEAESLKIYYMAGSSISAVNNINFSNDATPRITTQKVGNETVIKIEYFGNPGDSSYLKMGYGSYLDINYNLKVSDIAVAGEEKRLATLYATTNSENAQITTGWNGTGGYNVPAIDEVDGYVRNDVWSGRNAYNQGSRLLTIASNPIVISESSGSNDGVSYKQYSDKSSALIESSTLGIDFASEGYYLVKIINRTSNTITNVNLDLIYPDTSGTSEWAPKTIGTYEVQDAAGYTQASGYTIDDTDSSKLSISIPSLAANEGIIVVVPYTTPDFNKNLIGDKAYTTLDISYKLSGTDVNTTILGSAFALNEPTTYTVEYSGNGSTGGTAPNDSLSPYYENESVTVLPQGSLVKSNTRFTGWNTMANGSGTSYAANATFTITGNVTLYAQWINQYSVTYDGNGHTDGTAPVDSTTLYDVNSNVVVLGKGDLEKENWTFLGWSTTSTSTTAQYTAGNTFSITANMTLYAVWEENDQFSITYNGNGHTDGIIPVDSLSPYYENSTVTVLSEGSLEKENWTFAGWNTAQDGSGDGYAANATFTITEDLILYAQWTENDQYLISYNGNGNTDGTVPSDSSSPYYVNSSVTVLGENDLVKKNWTFVGWNTEQDGSGDSYLEGDSFIIEDHVILYAQWEENDKYTITYDGNGHEEGNLPVDLNEYYEEDEIVVLGTLDCISKSNHRFEGWLVSTTTRSVFSIPYVVLPGETITMPSNHVILTAVWTELYTVTYDGNGHTGGNVPIDETQYQTNDIATILDHTDLIRDGYTFKGWATTSDATEVGYVTGDGITIESGNVTLYAVWEKDATTVHVTPDTGVNAFGSIFMNGQFGLIELSLFYFLPCILLLGLYLSTRKELKKTKDLLYGNRK